DQRVLTSVARHQYVWVAVSVEVCDDTAKRRSARQVVKNTRPAGQEHLDLSVIETGHHIRNSVAVQIANAGKLGVTGGDREADERLEAASAIVMNNAEDTHA